MGRNARRDAEILERCQAGGTLRAVAKRYGITWQRVSQIVNERGFRPAVRNSLTTTRKAIEAVRRFGEGEDLASIVAAVGRGEEWVRDVLRRNGLEPPNRRIKYPDGPPHGYYRYRYYACRCDECRAANATYQRYINRDRARRLASLPSDRHGNRNTYNNWRCRCEPCTAANGRASADHRLRVAADAYEAR